MLADWRSDHRYAALETLPLWLISGLLAVASCGLLVVVTAANETIRDLIGITAGAAALLLYAVRDFSVVIGCNLGPSVRRADTAAAIYLLALYGVPIAMLSASGLGLLTGLVEPLSSFLNPFWLLFAAIWAAAGLELLRRRWLSGAPRLANPEPDFPVVISSGGRGQIAVCASAGVCSIR